MRNNKMKGFTLVELLVVIAILAILATVSVVGYTSYIEGAYVSNDNTVVGQLNSFAGVLKADMNSELFNKDITEDNVWEATQIILEEMAMEDLIPQALDYGYNFYYNFSTEKFELLKEKDVMPYGFKVIRDALAAGEGLKPGFFDYDGALVFLVNTTGSDLANAVRGFYTFDHIEDADKFGSFIQIVNGLDVAHNNIKNAAQNSVLVTKDGIFNGAGTLTGIIFHADKDLMLMETPAITLTAVDGKVEPIVIPNNVKYYGIGAINVTISGTASNAPVVINRYAEELAACLSEDFTNVTFVLADGKEWKMAIGTEGGSHAGTPVITTVEPSGVEYPIGGTNPMKDFDIFIANNDKSYTSIQENGLNIPTVVWHTGSVVLGLYENDIVAEDTTKPVSSKRVTWALTDENGNAKTYTGVALTEAGVLSLSRVGDFYPSHTTIYVTATAVRGDAKRTFAINLSRGTGATITVDDKIATNNATDVLWGEDTSEADGYKNSYTIAATLKEWDGSATRFNNDFVYDNDVKVVVPAGQTDIFGDADVVSTSTTILSGSTSSRDIVFEVIIGGYYKETVTITLNHGRRLFVPANGGLKFIGTNGADIIASELFKKVDSTATYTNVVVNAYLKPTAGTSMADLETGKLPTTAESGAKYGVFADRNVATMNQTFDFDLASATTPKTVVFVVTVNGIRASENYEVTIVNATNIREYVEANGVSGDELTTLISSNKLTGNVVLLEDIVMSGTQNYVEISSGKTFYGNANTFNVEAGRQASGIIILSGSTLRDTKIVGEVYPECVLARGSKYGSAVVQASSGALIDNCYIANGRSPVYVASGAVTVKDSVLFGGRYANIDIVSNKLIIEGTVTTIQTEVANNYNNKKVIGVGISAWFDDSQKFVEFTSGAELIQYNFLNTSISGSLPKITINLKDAGIDYDTDIPALDLVPIFNTLFDSSYSPYHFTNNGTTYVNSGIVAIDKHFNALPSVSIDGTGFLGAVKKGDKATFTFTSPVTQENASFVIEYNKSEFYEAAGDGNTTDGKYHVTTNLTKGQTISFTFYAAKTLASANVRSGDFKLVSGAGNMIFNTLNLNDTNLVTPYENTTFTYKIENLIQKGAITFGALDGKGLHNTYLDIDVYTPDNSDETNNERLEEYLAFVVTGKYDPSIYDFNENGTLTIYTIPQN